VDDAFVVRGGEGIGEGGCDLEDPLDLEPGERPVGAAAGLVESALGN